MPYPTETTITLRQAAVLSFSSAAITGSTIRLGNVASRANASLSCFHI